MTNTLGCTSACAYWQSIRLLVSLLTQTRHDCLKFLLSVCNICILILKKKHSFFSLNSNLTGCPVFYLATLPEVTIQGLFFFFKNFYWSIADL